jgi:uroporphyrinogen decarboxylase
MLKKYRLPDPKPDFDELSAVLLGKKKPQKVHPVEMLIDEEIKKALIEDYFGEINYPPTVTFGGSEEGVSEKTDFSANRETSDRYYRQLINFYHRLGYSVVADYEFLVNFQAFNTVSRIGKDPENTQFARDQRHWAQEGRGVIKSWEDFEKFPWKKADELVVIYCSHLEFLSKNLPDGMKLAVVGSVLEQVMEWLLGYEGVLYNVYDDPDFISAVFEKVGKLVYDLYSVSAGFEKVGVIWHGDDLGYRSGTMLSPAQLRKWVFPWFKKYAELAHRCNKPIWLHACGNKKEVMGDFIHDIKFDAVHSFEDTCCPVTDYSSLYGKEIGLLGGVDIDKITRLEEPQLRKYIRSILDICMENGRFALGSGNSVTNFTPVENFLIMLDEGNNYTS